MLRANGVTHYKDIDLELSLGDAPKLAVPVEVEEKSVSENLKNVEDELSGVDSQYRKLFTVGAVS
jgi:hypothetical protein